MFEPGPHSQQYERGTQPRGMADVGIKYLWLQLFVCHISELSRDCLSSNRGSFGFMEYPEDMNVETQLVYQMESLK